MSTAMPTPPGTPDEQTLRQLVTELGAELRARRDPEHLYTVAVVGAFGAVAWGVAALAGSGRTSIWLFDASIVAAAGIVFVAAVVHRKISREHSLYAELRQEQRRVLGLLASEMKFGVSTYPQGMYSGVAGPGHKYSLRVGWGSAAAAVAFCLAVFFSKLA